MLKLTRLGHIKCNSRCRQWLLQTKVRHKKQRKVVIAHNLMNEPETMWTFGKHHTDARSRLHCVFGPLQAMCARDVNDPQ